MAPSKLHNHYITGHGYKRRPVNLLGAILSQCGFSLLWKFYWAGARAPEYAKLRSVSLRDVNSLTVRLCMGGLTVLGAGTLPISFFRIVSKL